MIADATVSSAGFGGGRAYLATLLVLVVSGLAAVWSLTQPWVTATNNSGFGDQTTTVSGASVYPLSLAGAWIGLACAVAVVATSRLIRQAVGFVISVAAVAVLVGSVSFIFASEVELATEAGRVAAASAERSSAWVVTAACGLVMFCSGLLVARYGARWRSLSSKQSGTQQRMPTAWEALDRGEDPTA